LTRNEVSLEDIACNTEKGNEDKRSRYIQEDYSRSGKCKGKSIYLKLKTERDIPSEVAEK
jgi:hypothetical protein